MGGQGVPEGRLLRDVADSAWETSGIGQYVAWLRRERGLMVEDYDDLWAWSVDDLEGFWSSVWQFTGVRAHSPYRRVIGSRSMPGATWFEGARLNYAEHALGDLENRTDDPLPAIVAYSQSRDTRTLTWRELRDEVARARAGLRRLGVERGDRVVAYLPNIPEAVVAYLATASLGAIWASCAPEFGASAVIDRFGQLEPKVVLAVSGYTYGSKSVDRRAEVAAILSRMPAEAALVEVPYGAAGLPDALQWSELTAEHEPLVVEPVDFDHPLHVLFSSGTTGRPKAIMQSHGGILLEHLKNHRLAWDLDRGDRLMWFSTTAWMMWNTLVSALLVGAVPILIDGNPLYPDLSEQWRIAEKSGATFVGLSPGYVAECRRAGIDPSRDHDLSRVRQVGVSGAPLSPDSAAWLADVLDPATVINACSGGTDVCSGLLQANPLVPSWAGELSRPCLGVAVAAYGPDHRPISDGVGELVITQPMPSMPVGFWGDDGSALRAAYFDDIPGVWRHGDWVRITPRGSWVIEGRSDATLNRGGVRLGTADFYAVTESLPEIADSLVVHLEDRDGGPGLLYLFVVPSNGVVLDEALERDLRGHLRRSLSPRHVPDHVVAVAAVPRNKTGKRLEVPVKRLLQGADPDAVVSAGVLADEASLDPFIALGGNARA